MAPRSNLAFGALTDPTRRAILRFLADRGECPVGEIAAEVGTVSRAGVSTHLRILRAAEMVKERRDGRYRLYSLEPEAVDGVVEYLISLYRSPLAEVKRLVEDRTEDQTPAEGADRGGRTRSRR
jgi:ArsR family transcriptional regulator, arsenate/arsenite/antimonite-responsive transcriptional repressor